MTRSSGLRYADEKRRLTRFVNGLIGLGTDVSALIPVSRAKALTGTAAIELRPTNDVMLYLKHASGYKSGGFNTANTITLATLSEVGPVRPERVANYEAGLRSEWFDHRLRVNITGFYMNYRGIQALSTNIDPLDPNKFSNRFFNLDKVRIYGSEMEFQFSPDKAWDFNWAVGLLNTRCLVPACDGWV